MNNNPDNNNPCAPGATIPASNSSAVPDPAAVMPDTVDPTLDVAAPTPNTAAPMAPDSAVRPDTSSPRCRKPRELSRKQALWCDAYANPEGPAFGNKAKAAELAGYKGAPGSVQLAVQGHRNANNPTIRRALGEVLDEAGCTVELGARRLREGMDATRRKSFLAKNGQVVYSEREPDYAERRHATEFVFRLRGELDPRRQPAPTRVIFDPIMVNGEVVDPLDRPAAGETLIVRQPAPVQAKGKWDLDPERVQELLRQVETFPQVDRMILVKIMNMMLQSIRLRLKVWQEEQPSPPSREELDMQFRKIIGGWLESSKREIKTRQEAAAAEQAEQLKPPGGEDPS